MFWKSLPFSHFYTKINLHRQDKIRQNPTNGSFFVTYVGNLCFYMIVFVNYTQK